MLKERLLKKGMIYFFSLFLLFAGVNSANAGLLGCGADGSSFFTIFEESISTLYNVFPITIAGVPIKFFDLPTTDSIGGSPVCICMLGTPPIPHIGITFGWWNPQAVIETVKSPFCYPSLGVGLGSLGGKYFGGGKAESDKRQNSPTSGRTETAVYENMHYIKYPVFGVLDLFTDVMCLASQGIDLFYSTEFDPTWRDDSLAAVLDPESVLFANPIAQIMCIPDSVASTSGFPLDPLFWCMGSWGSAYPLAGLKQGTQVTASAGIAARGIYRMTRQLMLWQTIGRSVLCGPEPMPIWIKSQFSMYEAYPRLWPKRMPLGKAGVLPWASGANYPSPSKDDNFVWFLYQHHHCCLF